LIGWANAERQSCFLSVVRTTDRLNLVLIQWGVHDLVGWKEWEVPSEPASLRSALAQAFAWSNLPVEP